VTRARAIVGLLLAVPAAVQAEPRADGPCFGVFGQISPIIAVFDYPADGHGPSEKAALDLGVGGDVSRCRGWLELGVGARYDFADGAVDNAHFVAVPLWIGARLRIGAKGSLRLAVGAGPGFGVVVRNSTLITFGPSAEIVLGAGYRVGPELVLAIEIGARLDKLREINSDDAYLDGGELLHAQIPVFRAGATWR